MTVIACHNVSKAYGGHWAVQHLDLRIPQGAIVALVGPNGAGKSTTMKMMATLLEPTAGRIFIDGYDVVRDRESVRRSIGYLPDHFSLYDDMSVERCLDFYGACYGLPTDWRRQRIARLLDLLDLGSKASAKIAGLSRGMKQRVGIARAILHAPPVMLLDEPASGLDPGARVALRRLLVRLRDEEGATILISSHILTELNTFCDSIAVIQGGRILETGRIAEVQARLGGGIAPYTLTFHQGLDVAMRRLRTFHMVGELERRGDTLRFVHSARPEDSAALLRDLVEQGASVVGMEVGHNDMEWVYASVSTGAVN